MTPLYPLYVHCVHTNIGYGPYTVYREPTTYITGTVEDEKKDIGI